MYRLLKACSLALVISLLAYVITYGIVANVSAQTTTPTAKVTTTSKTSSAKIKQLKDIDEGNSIDRQNLPKTVDSQFNFVLASMTKSVAGCSSTGIAKDYDGTACTSGGVAGILNKSVLAMFTAKPAGTGTYIADLLESANIAQPAYAQGLGFSSLDPLLETWKVFRNLAYMFFIITFVVIGFMIMFRQKIGQSAITAQQAIPQIIIALIMVTFSYAIAGFLIDLMYLFMYLLVGIFGAEENLVNLNFLQLGTSLYTRGWSAVDAIGDFVNASLVSLTEVIATPIEWLSEITFFFIIMVAITIGIFRLFFELLKTYVSLIVVIALAPLFLMLGAIPGRSVFGGWLKNIYGNLAAFPTVLVVLIIYDMIINARGIDQGGFLPPYLFGTGSGGTIPALIGMAFIFALPEIVQQVKKAFGVTDSFKWLADAAGKNLVRGEVGFPLIGGAIQGAQQIGQARSYIRDQGIDNFRTKMGIYLSGRKGDEQVLKGGGLSGGIQRGFERGSAIRNLIDSIRDGTIVNPDRSLNYLKGIDQRLKNQKPASQDEEGGRGGASG